MSTTKKPPRRLSSTSVVAPIKRPTTSRKSMPIAIPLIPIREGVLFPHTESVLSFSRPTSINALHNLRHSDNLVLLVTQKNSEIDDPKADDLYTIGTVAKVERQFHANKNINALVKGLSRVRITKVIDGNLTHLGQYELLPDRYEPSEELTILSEHMEKQFRQAVQMGKPVEFLNFMKLMNKVAPSELADQIASTLSCSSAEKQSILEAVDVVKRVKLVLRYLDQEMQVMEIEKDVVSKTQKKFDKNMRENVLRERLRTIQKELGEIDDEDEVVDEYQQKLKKISLPDVVETKVEKEIKRLRQMSPNNPESGYVRTWLDTVFELPWGKHSKANASISEAEKTLDKSHHALGKVKDRILEHIAVLELKQKTARKKSDRHLPTILCFVGPPGVGKTSIGRSIAAALRRKFVKVSLGGIKDEAEIRGHRRTYVGAMPGRIITGIKNVGSLNPVFMLDEIDKVGNDFRGDPSSALLEALDPEQNWNFEDHYLDLPFDLSEVMFITTANTLETIPPALRDRLEVIRYSGYTAEEKFVIAKKHLVPKVRAANGLTSQQISLSDAALTFIIDRYTREAGVRDLERNLNAIMRKAARHFAEKKLPRKLVIGIKQIKRDLGPEKYDIESASRKNIVGQATGLAWTSVGGDTLFVEVALYPGKGLVQLTGKLGEVMKESAQAAFTYAKANADKLGIDPKQIANSNIHIHVPEGAIPKDGPSAGITLVTAIVSAFTKRAVRKDIAMTGEVTLRGRVLRIGGLKEKSIAALRAGITTVIIPKANERDITELPKSVRSALRFIPVENVSEVLKLALLKKTVA